MRLDRIIFSKLISENMFKGNITYAAPVYYKPDSQLDTASTKACNYTRLNLHAKTEIQIQKPDPKLIQK